MLLGTVLLPINMHGPLQWHYIYIYKALISCDRFLERFKTPEEKKMITDYQKSLLELLFKSRTTKTMTRAE